jgi:hypothetical protein
MWENRSESLKEYTYDLIIKRRKNARVECKIWEKACRKSASSTPRIRTSLYKAGLVYRQASLLLRILEETAAPRVNGDVTMEVLAQLRPSGRILDNFRVALAGSKALDFDADLFSLIPAAVFKGWRVKGQCWARDVAIRADVFLSGWIDLAATITMRELDVFDAEGAGIPAGEFLRIVNDLDKDGPCAASYRFAVVVGEDNKPRLQIQSLPASAVFLSGKALLKG